MVLFFTMGFEQGGAKRGEGGGRHGGRLIILDENKPDTYETENIFIDRVTDGKL